MQYKPFGPSYAEYVKLIKEDESARDRLSDEWWENNYTWFKEKIKEYNSVFLVTLGNSGRVYQHGKDIDDFPDNNELERIAIETGEVPLAFPDIEPPEDLDQSPN